MAMAGNPMTCKYCGRPLKIELIDKSGPHEKEGFAKPGPYKRCTFCDSAADPITDVAPLYPPRNKSRRCNYCNTCWPIHDDYVTCPLCREATIPSATTAIPFSAAASMRAEFDFGWYLWDTTINDLPTPAPEPPDPESRRPEDTNLHGPGWDGECI